MSNNESTDRQLNRNEINKTVRKLNHLGDTIKSLNKRIEDAKKGEQTGETDTIDGLEAFRDHCLQEFRIYCRYWNNLRAFPNNHDTLEECRESVLQGIRYTESANENINNT